MKLTSTQLRQIIKEEISRVSRKQESRNYPVRETESVLAAFEDLKGRETNLESGVLLADLAFSLSTTSENLIKSTAFKDSGLVVKVVEKGQITANESTAYRKGMLLEGHNRITPEEMEAWTRGDWAFVSESKELTDQLEKMSVEQLQEEYYNLDPDGNKLFGTGLIYGSGGEVQIDPSSKTYQDALKMLLVAAISELKEPGSTAPVDQPQQSRKIADLLRARGIEAY